MKNIIRYLLFVLSGFAVFIRVYENVEYRVDVLLQQLGFRRRKLILMK